MVDFDYYGDPLYIGDIPINKDRAMIYFDKNDGLPVLIPLLSDYSDTDEIMTYKLLNGLNGNKLIYSSMLRQVSFVKEDIGSNVYRVPCSRKWYDRSDMLNILALFCCVAVATLWLTNLFTSIFKKGGLLSGLF